MTTHHAQEHDRNDDNQGFGELVEFPDNEKQPVIQEGVRKFVCEALIEREFHR